MIIACTESMPPVFDGVEIQKKRPYSASDPADTPRAPSAAKWPWVFIVGRCIGVMEKGMSCRWAQKDQ